LLLEAHSVGSARLAQQKYVKTVSKLAE